MKVLKHFTGLPLWAQLALTYVGAIIVMVAIGGWVMSESAERYLSQLQRQGHVQTLNLLQGAALEPLIMGDVPFLETLLEEVGRQQSSIRSIQVEDRNGTILSVWKSDQASNLSAGEVTGEDVTLEGETFGRIVVEWNNLQSEAGIQEQSRRLRVILAVNLIFLMIILIIGVHWLVLRPLARIDHHLNAVADPSRNDRVGLPRYTAHEFHSLGEAVNSLGGAMAAEREFSDKLRDKEEQLRLITDNLPVLIAYVDRELRCQFMNQTGTNLCGPAAAEYGGRHFQEIIGPRNFEELLPLLENLLHGEPSVYEGLLSFAGGVERVLEVTLVPHGESHGHIVGFFVLALEVTERRALETELRQRAKMDAIGTLAGGIAHDLNNVLLPVLGLTKLTMDQLPPDGQAHTNLSKVLEASNRAKELVQQILAFSRADQPTRDPLELHTVATEVLQFVRSTLPATIDIRQKLDPATGVVLGDPIQIHQVLMNLATNAMHAMEDHGGTLEITLEPVEVDAELAARCPGLKPGPHARFTISDAGCGMDAQTLERIFDPFFTTKEVGEGTGMGLAVVHGIVGKHEGAITVSSTPGQGTIFEVYLPLHTEEADLSHGSPDGKPQALLTNTDLNQQAPGNA